MKLDNLRWREPPAKNGPESRRGTVCSFRNGIPTSLCNSNLRPLFCGSVTEFISLVVLETALARYRRTSVATYCTSCTSYSVCDSISSSGTPFLPFEIHLKPLSSRPLTYKFQYKISSVHKLSQSFLGVTRRMYIDGITRKKKQKSNKVGSISNERRRRKHQETLQGLLLTVAMVSSER